MTTNRKQFRSKGFNYFESALNFYSIEEDDALLTPLNAAPDPDDNDDRSFYEENEDYQNNSNGWSEDEDQEEGYQFHTRDNFHDNRYDSL